MIWTWKVRSNRIDLDGSGPLEEGEFPNTTLETVYVVIHGEEIGRKMGGGRVLFLFSVGRVPTLPPLLVTSGVSDSPSAHSHCIRNWTGGRVGSELAEVRTDADVEIMIRRFAPLLKFALDETFAKFSSNGVSNID